MTLSHARAMLPVYARVVRDYGRFSTLSLIAEGGIPSIKDDAKDTLAELSKQNDPFAIQSLLVVTGTGFRAAALRAAIAGVSLMSKVRAKVFTTEAAAIEELIAKTKPSMPEIALSQPQLVALCAALHQSNTKNANTV